MPLTWMRRWKRAVQVWSFGPALLDAEGKSIDKFNTNIAGLNPRAALGYYEPGHYCFVVVDGRGENGSRGYKLESSPAFLKVSVARSPANFDGGKSAVMVWDGDTTVTRRPAAAGT